MQTISLKHYTSLKKYTNEELLAELQILVSQERTLSLRVLLFLKEIELRKLYLKRGHSSLFVFCVKELKYSEAMAYHRTGALKMIEEIPEAKRSVETGELSIATLSLVQSACNAKKRKTKVGVGLEEKKKLLDEIVGKSKKQTEKILAEHFPEIREALKPERVRQVGEDQVEVRLNMRSDLMEKLKRLKDLNAHKHPCPSYEELVELMADYMLDGIDPVRKAEKMEKRMARKMREKELRKNEARETQGLKTQELKNGEREEVGEARSNAAKPSAIKMDDTEQLSTVKVNQAANQTPDSNSKPSRHCSAQTERAVWVRAQSRCEHVDLETGHRCDETRRLQLDHMIPYAISQDSSEKNIELVCTAHNLYRATQWFGSEFMRQKMGSTQEASSPGILVL